MPEPVDPKSRRDLITKLLPYVAMSAIKAGIAGSPLNVLSDAVTKYNEDAEKTKELVKDLLPLIPGFERLHLTVVGSNAVSLVMKRQDLLSCAEMYLSKLFMLEGAAGAPAGPPPEGEEGGFQYVLRLPFKNVYLKVVEELTAAEASRILDFASRRNPVELWIVSDKGLRLDQRLDPVFVSESKILRGRVKSVPTAEMLRVFFGERFAVTLERRDQDSVEVTLRPST